MTTIIEIVNPIGAEVIEIAIPGLQGPGPTQAQIDALGTDQATANTVARRDAFGQSNFTRIFASQVPASASELTRKDYVDARAVPTGGTTGQVLAKTSATDRATAWVTPTGGGTGLDPLTYTEVAWTAGAVNFGVVGFNKVTFNGTYTTRRIVDAGSRWDNANSEYVVPATGTYMMNATLRRPDNSTQTSWGIGIHSLQSDGEWFAWAEVLGQRQARQYQRIAAFNTGDRLRLFQYGATDLIAASISIVRLF